MAQEIKVGLNLTDGGTIEVLTKKAQGLQRELSAIKKMLKETSSGAMAKSGTMSGIDENIAYRMASGVAGRAGGSSRDFAKQAQGLGGLVHLYATFAANIYAVGSAFNALNQAFSVQRLEESSKVLGSTMGVNLKGIAIDLQKATDYAISFQDSIKFGSVGTAAGLSAKQIKSLTVIAKGASNALGRDMGDSIDRIIRGTAKMEQEILDELGIFVRAKDAYKEYAKELGLTSEEALTSSQRVQAYANAVEKAGQKWEKFAKIEDPFSKFVARFKEAGTDLLNVVNSLITPVISALANSESLLKGVLLAGTAYLVNMAIPAIQQFANLSKSLPKYREEIQKLQDAFKAKQEEGLVKLNLEKTLGLDKLKAAIASSLETMPISQKSKQDLIERIMGSPADYEKYLKQSLRGAALSASNALKAATKEGDPLKIVTAEDKLLKIKTLQKELNSELSKEITNRTKVQSILADIERIDAKILTTQTAINSSQKPVTQDASYRRYERAKATSSILEGGANLGLMALLGKEGANLWKESTKELKLFDKTLVGLSTTMRGLGLAASLLLEPMMIIMGVMAAWSIVIEPLLNYFGLLNTKSQAFNETLTASESSLQTVKDSFITYNESIAAGSYNLEAYVQSQTILKNVFNQVTASISEQVKALKEWESNRTFLSDIVDFFGESNFEKSKRVVSKQLKEVIQMAQSEADKAKLTTALKAVESSTNIAAFEVAAKSAAPIMNAISLTAEKAGERIKAFEKAASDASTALTQEADKQLIKDKDLLAAYKQVESLYKTIESKKGLIPKEEIDDIIRTLQTVDPQSKFATLNKNFSELVVKAKQIADLENKIANDKKIAQSISADPAQDILDKLNKASNVIGESLGYILGTIGMLIYKGFTAIGEGILGIVQSFALKILSMANSIINFFPSMIEKFKELSKLSAEEVMIILWDSLKSAAKEIVTKGAPVGASIAAKALPGGAILENLFKNGSIMTGVSRAKAAATPKEDVKNTVAAIEAATKAEEKVLANLRAEFTSGLPEGLQGQLKGLITAGNQGTDRAANQQRLDAINNEITAQQKLIELTDYKIAQEQKKAGFADISLFNTKLEQENRKIDLEYSKQLLEAEQKYAAAKSKGSIEEKNRAIKAAEDARAFSKQKAQDEAMDKRIQNEVARYKIQVLDVDNEKLRVSKSAIDNAEALGQITAQEAIEAKYALDLQKAQSEEGALLNKLKESGIINLELQYGILEDIDKNELERIKNNKLLSKQERDRLLILEQTKQTIGNLTNQENLITSILAKQEGRGIFNIDLIDQLTNTKVVKLRKEIDRLPDGFEKQQKQLEILNVLYEGQLRMHEAMKRNFLDLTPDQMATVAVNEATLQVDRFRASMKDLVTGTFDAVYAGFDAGIEELTTKIMDGSEIKLKDLITTVRNSMAEEFRKLAADQMKLGVRQIGASIMQAITGKPTDLRTIEQQQLGYLQQIAANTSTMAMGQSFGTGSSLFDYTSQDGKSVSYDLEGKMKVFDETSNTWVESTQTAAKEVAGITNGVLGNFGGTVMQVFNGLGGGIIGLLQPILSLMGISIPGGMGGTGLLGSVAGIFGNIDLTGALGSVFGTSGVGGWLSGLPSTIAGIFGFANGGVMTDYGPLKLNKYSKGGIADSPQLALYGEGRKNEAYVPLPDNRSIPVTLNGGAGGDNVSFNITVNDNSTITSSQEGESSNKERQQGYQDFSKLIAQKVREEMVNQKRPGGLLYGG